MARSDSSIPPVYTAFFLYLEPACALGGAAYALFLPARYLQLTHPPSAPPSPADVPTATAVALAQLANLYLLFAVNEALVLRSTRDLRVWRTLLFGLLLADFGHLYSVAALGPAVYWHARSWNAMDWGNVAFVYLGATMRIAFLSGFGLAP